MSPRYRSPLTGDFWDDPRPLAAVVMGAALLADAQYPRRRPAPELAAALAQATRAVCGFAVLPRIVRNDPVIGPAIAESYWAAKDAHRALTPFVDALFVKHHDFWCQWREWVANYAGDEHMLALYDGPVSTQLRATRLAWLATRLVQKAACGGLDILDEFSFGHDALQGALRELDEAGVPREQAVEMERSWRFLAAAERLPRLPQDADLYAAFEAALLAGADDLAVDLVRRSTST